jgi:cob(I)alamin adenosyltransferase
MFQTLSPVDAAISTPAPSQRKSTPTISHLAIAPTQGNFQVFSTSQPSFHLEVMAQALRLASLGTPVLVVQFFQGGINQGIENPRILGQNLTWIRNQIDRHITPETIPTPQEIDLVLQLWAFVQAAIKTGNYGLVVLDELNLAIELNLISEAEVVDNLSDRPVTLDLILTGANMPTSLTEIADQVTHRRN